MTSYVVEVVLEPDGEPLCGVRRQVLPDRARLDGEMRLAGLELHRRRRFVRDLETELVAIERRERAGLVGLEPNEQPHVVAAALNGARRLQERDRIAVRISQRHQTPC